MHYVYVLLSEKDGKLYLGFTSNLKRRLKEHNRGKVQSTKPRRPFKLIYYEAHISKEDASRELLQNNERKVHFKANAKGVIERSNVLNS